MATFTEATMKPIAPPDRQKQWEDFKRVIAIRDPDFSNSIQALKGEEAFKKMCERYGLPARMLWSFINCDIYEIVERASLLHYEQTPLVAFEKPLFKKVLAAKGIPAFAVGRMAEVWAKAPNAAGTSFIRVTDDDGSFLAAFFPAEALGDAQAKHRLLDLS